MNIRALFTINGKECILTIPTNLTPNDHAVTLVQKDPYQELLHVEIVTPAKQIEVITLEKESEFKQPKSNEPEKKKNPPKFTGKSVTDHKGVKFNSIKEMCEAWDITPATYSARIKQGWSMQIALTTPVRGFTHIQD